MFLVSTLLYAIISETLHYLREIFQENTNLMLCKIGALMRSVSIASLQDNSSMPPRIPRTLSFRQA